MPSTVLLTLFLFCTYTISVPIPLLYVLVINQLDVYFAAESCPQCNANQVYWTAVDQSWNMWMCRRIRTRRYVMRFIISSHEHKYCKVYSLCYCLSSVMQECKMWVQWRTYVSLNECFVLIGTDLKLQLTSDMILVFDLIVSLWLSAYLAIHLA